MMTFISSFTRSIYHRLAALPVLSDRSITIPIADRVLNSMLGYSTRTQRLELLHQKGTPLTAEEKVLIETAKELRALMPNDWNINEAFVQAVMKLIETKPLIAANAVAAIEQSIIITKRGGYDPQRLIEAVLPWMSGKRFSGLAKNPDILLLFPRIIIRLIRKGVDPVEYFLNSPGINDIIPKPTRFYLV